MDAIALHDLAVACGGRLHRGVGSALARRVSKDTRALAAGDLYWCLRGENFDGHDFVAAAVDAGAIGAVAERAVAVPEGFSLILVSDTLAALQQLAAWHRARLRAKVVCVTGSNGKTSTKDFTAAIAATRFSVSKTEGNLNNHIGLPLTILSASPEDEVAVWEIGMNHPGEIAALARLARPDIGIITNVGVAHIEFLGSREAIAREKGALGEALSEGGALILPRSEEFAPALAAATVARVVEVGDGAAVRAERVRSSGQGAEFDLIAGAERIPAYLPVPGSHMVGNALLAVAAGLELGLSARECAQALAGARLSKGRLALLDVRGVTVLDDSYNANPDSMEAALRALGGLTSAGRRFAVLGKMGELGFYAGEGYRRVGRAAGGAADVLIAVGPETEPLAAEAEASGAREVRRAADTGAAARLLRELANPGDAVLIKGSRAARMERVLEDFA